MERSTVHSNLAGAHAGDHAYVVHGHTGGRRRAVRVVGVCTVRMDDGRPPVGCDEPLAREIENVLVYSSCWLVEVCAVHRRRNHPMPAGRALILHFRCTLLVLRVCVSSGGGRAHAWGWPAAATTGRSQLARPGAPAVGARAAGVSPSAGFLASLSEEPAAYVSLGRLRVPGFQFPHFHQHSADRTVRVCMAVLYFNQLWIEVGLCATKQSRSISK